MSSPARIALFFVLSLTHGPSVSFAQSPTHEQQYNIGALPVPPSALKQIRTALQREDPLDPEDHVDVNTFQAIIVTLGTTPHLSIEVTASGIVCGATGNCPIWLFDRNTGAMLITNNGYDILYADTLHHGRPDISVQHNLSCCDGTRHNYRFNGTQYKLLRSVIEETQPRPDS